MQEEALRMIGLDNLMILAVGVAVGFFARPLILQGTRHWARVGAAAFSDLGISLEVDCRICGQINRVPSTRLRDRPKCARCKRTLMPGRRVALCHANVLEGPLGEELGVVWVDAELLWNRLARYVALQAPASGVSGDQPGF
jgi:hypothetical protein